MMHSRLFKSRLIICGFLCFILASCQSTPPAPSLATATLTSQPTALPTGTASPKPSDTPQSSPTPLPHLALGLESVQGAQIDFWHPWRGDLAGRADEAARQFNKENTWGIVVRVHALNSAPALYEAVDGVSAEAPAKDAPEVVAAASEELAAWMAAGRLAGLDDYVSHADWGMQPDEVTAFSAVFWQQDQWSGPNGVVQAGIPAVRSGRVLFYNQTWANDLGFSQAPLTPEEFQAQACAAAQANNAAPDFSKHFTGGWLVDADSLTLLSWLDGFGAQVLPVVDGAPYTFQSEAAESATGYLRKLFDTGCAWEGRSPTPHEYFANRMALFYSGTLQDLPIQAAAQQRINSGDRWVILPYPAEEGPGSVYSYGYSYAVLAGSPEQQLAAWLFVRWMSNPRNQALLAEVWPSFPVSSSSERALVDYKNNFPWSMILPLQPDIKPAPAIPSWRKVRVILEDAALMQLFRLPVDQMQFFLPEVDQTAREVLLQEQIER